MRFIYSDKLCFFTCLCMKKQSSINVLTQFHQISALVVLNYNFKKLGFCCHAHIAD